MEVPMRLNVAWMCLLALAMPAGCDGGGDTPTPPPAPAPKPTAANDDKPSTPRAPVHVVMDTGMGRIVLELLPAKAPITVDNFLRYVDAKHYDGTLFHRVMDGFMVQGGGFTPQLREKPTGPPIQNEATNGLKNTRGTIAMARLTDPHSATAQFYINVADNASLDHPLPDGSHGYAVFGRVIEGMDVVDAIKAVATRDLPNGMKNVPVEPVVIEKVRRQ
jgi:cyclophilin family peptidyl-prolyl cis-trans isomerase